VIRLFAAIAIPPEIGEGLTRRQQGLPGARWRRTEVFHVTLRFFGEIAERLADDLDAELGAVSGQALTLWLEGVGAFQDGGEVHAVWAGVAENEPLKRLAARCETAARRAGLPADRRAWRPHVTLAYLRRANPVRVAAWIQGHNLLKSPPFRVTSFGLYSSHLAGEGASYRLERSYPLGLATSCLPFTVIPAAAAKRRRAGTCKGPAPVRGPG
jgi:2'-5' RNA ligase